MKIVVFAPHPDDEIFGSGGSILKWLDEGHNIHLIYLTDNRALVKWGQRENQLLEECAQIYQDMTEDEIAQIALEEAKIVSKKLGLSEDHVHLFEFHDQGVMDKIQQGIELAMKIIPNSDRIVMPSDHNNHIDHQATHIIAKNSAQQLSLDRTEFYVYALYNILKAPRDKQVKIKVKKYRNKLYELMKCYKTQLCLKDTRIGWQTLKRRRSERFGVFKLTDMDNYENF
jgi:LmbE family N-acetylglucosaminyl deacetylase